MQLEHAMTYRLDVRGPVKSTDASIAAPRRQFWQMERATLEGQRIHATTPSPGIDWFTPHHDGFGRPHVRIPFQTNDGAVVLLEYRGIVHASSAFTKAVASNQATQWDDQYMRMAMMFETDSSRYQWLTESLFIARGRLLAAFSLEYEVYRVT